MFDVSLASKGTQDQAMQKAVSRIIIFGLCAVTIALAQNKVPRFKEYAVNDAYIGKNAPLILGKDDRAYRTKLQEAAKNKPNFAGHYILTAFGCGASCLMGAVIDAKTGKVFWFPHTICCWGENVDDKFNPIEFRLESKLIIFSGLRNEKDGDDGAHFYKFENGQFTHLTTVRKNT